LQFKSLFEIDSFFLLPVAAIPPSCGWWLQISPGFTSFPGHKLFRVCLPPLFFIQFFLSFWRFSAFCHLQTARILIWRRADVSLPLPSLYFNLFVLVLLSRTSFPSLPPQEGAGVKVPRDRKRSSLTLSAFLFKAKFFLDTMDEISQLDQSPPPKPFLPLLTPSLFFLFRLLTFPQETSCPSVSPEPFLVPCFFRLSFR